MREKPSHSLSSADLGEVAALEAKEFEKAYRWIEEHLPPTFFEEIGPSERILIARNLLSFQQQDFFSQIHLKDRAIIICHDVPDADLQVFQKHAHYAIRYYRAFVSNVPWPASSAKLRICLLIFRKPMEHLEEKLDPQKKAEIKALIKERSPRLQEAEIEALLHQLTSRFLRSMTPERLSIALDMFFRARTEDLCQYELRRNEDWEKKNAPSLQLILAWRNVPTCGFLSKLAECAHAHGLGLRRTVAADVDVYSTNSVMILSLGLHGLNGKAAWEAADIDAFVQEVVLLKYFDTDDLVTEVFVESGLLRGSQAHLVRNFASFIHQTLVHGDPYFYSYEHVVEGLCRHPELTVLLCKLFETKFHPLKQNEAEHSALKKELLEAIDKLDTGQANNDTLRKNVLKQALFFVTYCLKTNAYLHNKNAFAFRLDPEYLSHVPYDRGGKFPEIPYGIFFIRGMHYIGFSIRFKDLARGGMRTVIPQKKEQFLTERDSIFSEAYQLALTQQKKNKDIPEGGSKTAVLLEPYETFALEEEQMYLREMQLEGIDPAIQKEKLAIYRRHLKLEYLYFSQRSYIENLMTLINCDDKGNLHAKEIVDFWKKPEYIYLGPDENMYNDMLIWIVDYAIKSRYKPGRAFMSSSPKSGLNHKEIGVTSLGVNVYLHEALLSIGIDPEKDPFTIKISGGPDGDVAGNELHILASRYPKTARLLALTDVSGTINDLQGLEWAEMDRLFKEGLPIRNYPPEKLSEGGFLLDLQAKREQSAYAQQTLCYRKKGGKVIEEWLSGHEMNYLYRNNVHQTKTDAFVPGGGRPRTLNEANYQSFLDETGKPTSKIIVEGANLYLTPGARRALETLGVIVLKDSSCNKGGVICSSFEVLANLCMSEQDFLAHKPSYIQEVLHIIKRACLQEARLILHTHQQTGAWFTDISEKISEKINLFKYQILEHLETLTLSHDPQDPFTRCLIHYCPPLLKTHYLTAILHLPDIHKKAIIASHVASQLVYKKGLDWNPSISDILPLIIQDSELFS